MFPHHPERSTVASVSISLLAAMTTALSGITRRRILGLAAVAAGALVLTGALGVVTFILVTHKPPAHPHPTVTVKVPVPAATITVGAAAAKPQPTVTVTEVVASAPSGGSGWGVVAAAGTAVGGLGGLVAGIAAVAALVRRKPETAPPAQATSTASP